MKEQIYKKTEQIFPELIEALRELVAIESVEGESSPSEPYGPGPKQALEKALEISERLGFETQNIDNQIGYASHGPKDDEYYGIFGHVDVVPLGEGWTYDPLGGEIANNKIYGRGVLDNKGPILANLFALYILKELNISLPKPVRIVFGTNEESGFGCVKHYLTKENPPIFGWTPDNKWPVVYGERGRAVIEVIDEGNFKEFSQFITEYILSSPTNGKKLGINFNDDHFGEMIMRGYRLEEINGKPAFVFSLSYPTNKTGVELTELIREKAPQTVTVNLKTNWEPVLNDIESIFPIIEELTDAYEEVMGERLAPTTTTGGTYAKLVPNLIAYGPSFPGQNGIAHLPDEWMDLDDLKNMTKIYVLALYKLSQMNNS